MPKESSITLSVTIEPKVQFNGDNVDELKSPVVLKTTHDGETIGPGENKAASLECLDPRFNYDPFDSLHCWRERADYDPTNAPVADINSWTADWWLTNQNGDVTHEMHVANRPLQSVAELGCLMYSTNNPWATVKLYGPSLHPVLHKFGLQADHFSVNIGAGQFIVPEGRNYRTGDPVRLETPATGSLPAPLSADKIYYVIYNSENSFQLANSLNDALNRIPISISSEGTSDSVIIPLYINTISRGLVNCNPNAAVDATAVVFAGMPVDEYPGQGGGELSMPEARDFVAKLYAGGPFTNLSDIGRALTSGDFLSADNELKREAYFRNSVNLINLRQNVFTIIIEAQAASGGNIPRNPARQRAVAIVWRDPYTGEMFVRHIKWLSD